MLKRELLGSVAVSGALAVAAYGHVILESPNGGELLHAGSVYNIEWRVLIGHDTQNWDLYYSTESVGGTYMPIVIDLPVGDGSTGSMHTYAWTVPNVVADLAWVRVVQDNSSVDYQDSSNFPFAIVPAPGAVGLFACAGIGLLPRRR